MGTVKPLGVGATFVYLKVVVGVLTTYVPWLRPMGSDPQEGLYLYCSNKTSLGSILQFMYTPDASQNDATSYLFQSYWDIVLSRVLNSDTPNAYR